MERVPRKKAKKDGKLSLLMVTLAVVLCGVAAALFLLQKHPALPEPKPVERHFLSDVEEEALAAVLIAPKGKAAYPLVRTEKGMRLQGREEMPLRENILSDMLYAAGHVEAEIVIGPEGEIEDGRAAFGLAEPALRLVLTEKDGRKTEILFGDAVLQTDPEQYYALSGGVLYTVLAEPVDILFHDMEYLRDFTQPQIQGDLLDRIRVQGEEDILFTYTPDGFQMESPISYPAAQSKMNALLNRLESMAFEAYLGPAAEQDLAALGLEAPRITVTLNQAKSIISGQTTEGENVTLNVGEKDYVLQLGEKIGDTALYVLWKDGVYKASQFLFGFLEEMKAEDYLSQTPMNFTVDRLERLEVEGKGVYTVEMVEALTEENRIATDEYGQTLYDAKVKKNGEAADAEAFLNWYVQLNRLPMAGKLQQGQAYEEAPLYTLYLQTADTRRSISFHSMDALHAALSVDGVAKFYVEKSGLSLLETLP